MKLNVFLAISLPVLLSSVPVLFPNATSASPSPNCLGDFQLEGDGYVFDVHLEPSELGGFNGYMRQTYSPDGNWGNALSTVTGRCNDNRLELQRFIDSGVQNYDAYYINNGWTGTYTSPNTTTRYPFTMRSR